MGNRAVIETRRRDVGVYLHWNGGRDSVEAFLTYCKLKGFRAPEEDGYGWARLCQVIGNYFGGGLSVGIDVCDRLDEDNWDNGVYVIEDWEIVDRLYMHYDDEQRVHDLAEMLRDINNSQPRPERMPEPFLDPDADDHIAPEDLRAGDLVLFSDADKANKGGAVKGTPWKNSAGVTLVPVDEAYMARVCGQNIVRTLSAHATVSETVDDG